MGNGGEKVVGSGELGETAQKNGYQVQLVSTLHLSKKINI
jgi:hypothetical protein